MSLAALLLILAFPAAPQNSNTKRIEWPVVQSLRKDFDFPDAGKAEVKLYIRALHGKPLYRLECHPGEPANKQSYDEGDESSFSGAFQCILHAIPPDDFGDLLHEDPFLLEEWGSRGRVSPEEISEACRNYPDYGRVRHFRLRGMKITFVYSDLKFGTQSLGISLGTNGSDSPMQLKSFQFEVEVQSDPSAISAIAEPAGYDPPPSPSSNEPKTAAFDCRATEPAHVPGRVSNIYIRDQALGPPYPEILATEASFQVSRREHDNGLLFDNGAEFSMPIQDTRGKVVYEFVCSHHPYGDWYTRWVISCSLDLPGKDLNLLDDSTDPYSRMTRANILPQQLYGNCANYPEWGATRHFALRGLRLTLEVTHTKFDLKTKPDYFFIKGGLEKAEVHVRVEPDPAAKSPVALPSRYSFPVTWPAVPDCSTILVNE